MRARLLFLAPLALALALAGLAIAAPPQLLDVRVEVEPARTIASWRQAESVDRFCANAYSRDWRQRWSAPCQAGPAGPQRVELPAGAWHVFVEFYRGGQWLGESGPFEPAGAAPTATATRPPATSTATPTIRPPTATATAAPTATRPPTPTPTPDRRVFMPIIAR